METVFDVIMSTGGVLFSLVLLYAAVIVLYFIGVFIYKTPKELKRIADSLEALEPDDEEDDEDESEDEGNA